MDGNCGFATGACFSCATDFGTGGFAFGSGNGDGWYERVEDVCDDVKRRCDTTYTPSPSTWSD